MNSNQEETARRIAALTARERQVLALLPSGMTDHQLASRLGVDSRVSAAVFADRNGHLIRTAAQICLVYVVSGLFKVMGEVWQDGTALFYILRIPEFELPGVSELLYRNDWMVQIGTYTTVLFMVYFPLGILVRTLRPWTAVLSIGLHLSIAVLMGLTGFALTMVACDLVFLSAFLERLLTFGTALRRRMTERAPEPHRPAVQAAPAAAAAVSEEEEAIR